MSYFERNNAFKKHHGKVNAVASQKVMVELISKTGLDYKVRARRERGRTVYQLESRNTDLFIDESID